MDATPETQMKVTSLVIGAPVPPMTSDIPYDLQHYENVKVAWNSVPPPLHDLESPLWLDRKYLKQRFIYSKKQLDGPAFPICLLLNCDNLEDRLKVMSWWNHLGNYRKEEWKRISSKFARPTKSGKLLEFGKVSGSGGEKLSSVEHGEENAEEIQSRKRQRYAAVSASEQGFHGPKKAKLFNLRMPKDDIVAAIQEIYSQHRDEGLEESLLWDNVGFRNGIILLRSSYAHFERIPLLDNNEKVLLVCPQTPSGDNSRCEQFSIRNRLGLRWNADARCKYCQEKHKEIDNAEMKHTKLEEKYQKLRKEYEKQRHKIKRLENSLKRQQAKTDSMHQHWWDQQRNNQRQAYDMETSNV